MKIISNYHFEAKIISRGKGNSFARTANYISGVSLHDSYLDKTYYRKRGDVLHTDIILPPRAPPEFHDLQTLCDKIEAAEHRRDAQTAREFICSLPNELPVGELIQIVQEFVSHNYVEQGLGAIAAIHEGRNLANPFNNNPHVHILVTLRTIGPDGFNSKKDREHNRSDYIRIWREQWALVQNKGKLSKWHEKSPEFLEIPGIVCGPSGDIGFTEKPSDTNGLRASGQQYLHSKLNTEAEF